MSDEFFKRLPIDWSYFCSRTAKCLRDCGINNLSILKEMTEDQLRQIRGMGDKSVEEVNRYLTEWAF